MRYQLCVKQCGLRYIQRGFMYSGVYTKVLLCSWYDGLPPPRGLLFLLTPYPLFKGRYPVSNIFGGCMFRAWRGRNCSRSPCGGFSLLRGLRTPLTHTKCAVVQVWLEQLSPFYSDGYVYAVNMYLPMCIDFGVLSTCLYLIFDN